MKLAGPVCLCSLAYFPGEAWHRVDQPISRVCLRRRRLGTKTVVGPAFVLVGAVRCPGQKVMSTCLCTATRDVCAGYVAPTSHVLTCSWVSGPRPSDKVIPPSSYGCAKLFGRKCTVEHRLAAKPSAGAKALAGVVRRNNCFSDGNVNRRRAIIEIGLKLQGRSGSAGPSNGTVSLVPRRPPHR